MSLDWIATAVFDTKAVLAAHPTPSQLPNSPTVIDQSLGFLVAPPAEIKGGQGTPKLIIPRSSTGDSHANVTLRAISVSGDPYHAVYIYGVPNLGPRFVTLGFYEVDLSTAAPILHDDQVVQPPQYIPSNGVDYSLAATVGLDPDNEFLLNFIITDTSSGVGVTLGFFSWTCWFSFG